MIKKRSAGMILSAFMLVFSLTSCQANTTGSQAGADKLPKVINIGTQQMPNDENVVKAKGFFEELGVKVNLIEFDSGKDVNAALTAKSIDLGLLGSSPATIAIAQGIPIEVIWIHDIIGEAESLAVKNSSNVNKISDLTGKKIATPFGSTAHYSLLNTLAVNHLSLKDVTILDMQPSDIYAAWQRNDIDAAYVWQPTLGSILTDGKIIASSADLAEGGIITSDIEVVRTEFGAQYPDLVADYIRLQIKAHDLYKDDFAAVVKVIAKAFTIGEQESQLQIEGFIWLAAQEQLDQKYLGTTSQKGDFAKALKDTADFLAGQKTIQATADIAVFEKAINPGYIERALTQQ